MTAPDEHDPAAAPADSDPARRPAHEEWIDDFLQIRDPDFWTIIANVTPKEAAAVITGIDPEQLEELKDHQIENQPGEEQIEFNYGSKHGSYRRNLRLIEAAVSVGELPLVEGRIPRTILYPWAKTRGLFDPAQAGPETYNVIDVFLESFLGANYQDYTRLKLAILGAKKYATGEAVNQQEVMDYLEEVAEGKEPGSERARKKIAYVAQPDSMARPGRRGKE